MDDEKLDEFVADRFDHWDGVYLGIADRYLVDSEIDCRDTINNHIEWWAQKELGFFTKEEQEKIKQKARHIVKCKMLDKLAEDLGVSIYKM